MELLVAPTCHCQVEEGNTFDRDRKTQTERQKQSETGCHEHGKMRVF